MNRIILAVFLEEELQSGGGFQQSLNAALETKKIPKENAEVIFITTIKSNISILKSLGISAIHMHMSRLDRLLLRLRKKVSSTILLNILTKWYGENSFEKFLNKFKIDLVYFTGPSVWATYLEKLNYIYTVWDLCYRDDVEFPEIRENRTFENRDILFQQTLTKAIAVIVDSELGKENVSRRFAVDDSRIVVQPFSPAYEVRKNSERKLGNSSVNIQKLYNFDGDYIFYPAQFWPHKNHVYILDGLKILQEKYQISLNVLFSGADKGNLEYVKSYALKLGVSNKVHFIGFVDNEIVPELYIQSLALVMPTYFGPTNLPPLEAFSLGVPVLYSDKAGLREQVGDAALLMDLSDPHSLADSLKMLNDAEEVRDKLIEAGKKRLLELAKIDKTLGLVRVIKEFQSRRNCWK